MEAITLASTCIDLAGVALRLYNAINKLQEVDNTIQELQAGVKQVEDICRVVEKHIRLFPYAEAGSEDDEELFIGIKVQLSSCNAVIHKVESRIKSVRRGTNDTVGQVVRKDGSSNCTI